VFTHPFLEIDKASLTDAFPDIVHQSLEKMDVMITHQPASQYFTGIEEMSQVRPGEMAAGVTGALLIKGCLVSGIGTCLDNDLPFRGERHPGPSVAGREHAVEQVDTETHCFQDVFRISTTHEISNLARGEHLVHLRDHFKGDSGWFADHKTTDAVSVKFEVDEPPTAFFSETFIGCALDYAE
jgi:hypothetical protein